MKNQFIPYEQALALKLLDFDEPCFAYWGGGNEPMIMPQRGTFYVSQYDTYRNTYLSYDKGKSGIPNEKDFKQDLIDNPDKYTRHMWGLQVSAPTWQQAFDWFREKHNLRIRNYGSLNYSGGISEYFEIFQYAKNTSDKTLSIQTGALTYENAKLECLKKLIEIVKENSIRS
jgi:hypothetical protein